MVPCGTVTIVKYFPVDDGKNFPAVDELMQL